MAELSPILRDWRITENDACDEGAGDEVETYIRFESGGGGEFQFAHIQGTLDHRLVTRNGKVAVEWSWEGNDETDELTGRGWAAVEPDGCLRGCLFIHGGDDSTFVARKRLPKPPRKPPMTPPTKPAATLPTKPAMTLPTKPATTLPAKPAATLPTKPATTFPAKPAK
jgi:hypothetical protein